MELQANQIRCPQCSVTMTFKDRLAGKTVNCLKCKAPFKIPPAKVAEAFYSNSHLSIGIGGEISLAVETLVDAKIAINNLRLQKKHLQLELKTINVEFRQISKAFNEMAQRMVKVPKLPKNSDIARNLMQCGLNAQNDKIESQMRTIKASRLPLEDRKTHVENGIAQIERAVILVENWILQQGSNKDAG